MNQSDIIQSFLESNFIPSSSLKVLGANEGAVVLSAMNSILPEFSRDSRLRKTASGTWSGSDITLDGWYDESLLVSVESPVGERPPVYIPSRDIVLLPDVGKVYFVVSNGAEYVVTYTVMHSLPEDTDATIPSNRITAFFKLTVGELFKKLASKHAETTGSPMLGDSVNYQTKTGEYLRLAREAHAEYRRLMNLPEKPVQRPASVSSEYDNTRVLPLEAPWPAR